jgi:hypothetical protein
MGSSNKQISDTYEKNCFVSGVCSKWNELPKKLISGGIKA